MGNRRYSHAVRALIAALGLSVVAASAHAATKTKITVDEGVKTRSVTLKEFTNISLDIVPDNGTRLIFPFVLDNDGNSVVPFTSDVTNGEIFKAIRHQGRNSLLINVPAPEGGGKIRPYKGTFFASFAGYNLTIKLTATNSRKNHLDNVVFDLPAKKREFLIDDAVTQRIAVIKKEYDLKRQQDATLLDHKALSYAAHFAAIKPGSDNMKEEVRVSVGESGAAEIYINKVLDYSRYRVLLFEVTNLGQIELTLRDVQLTAIEDSIETLIPGSFYCAGSIRNGGTRKCTYATTHINFADAPLLKLALTTNVGEAIVKW